MNNKKFQILCAFCMFLLGLVGCSTKTEEMIISTSIPGEVQSFLEEYLEARKTKDNHYTVNYVYFLEENADSYYYYANNTNQLFEYEILSSKRINESLYAFLIDFETEITQETGEDLVCYNYVARIGDEWRIITNKRNIPEDLKENFVDSDFENPEVNDRNTLVNADDVI